MAEDAVLAARADVCDHIQRIMATYDEQMAANGYVGTPGGLEHMGDVWRLLGKWRRMLDAAALPPPPKDPAT